ncbi:uncharacterized protein LOC124125139 [Haliotis rufescens]|uniref:uncharacterized protein LOC124125139 n=1 Tax=Haliotis rufescens TaxID=6454 RepID=UPI00201EB35F|nr:uncharacterized protein LOC124125139 [Haliotis rufescens]
MGNISTLSSRLTDFNSHLQPQEYDFLVDLTTGRYITHTTDVTWHSPLVSSGTCAMRGVLKLNFGAPDSPSRQNVVLIYLWFSSPRGWSVDIGDSAANNGYGGDFRRRTGRDAEVSGRGSSLFVVGSDYDTGRPRVKSIVRNFLLTEVSIIIADGIVVWSNLEQVYNATVGTDLFALNGQPDIRNNPPNFDIYLGLNRVIAYQARRGRGLCAAGVSWLN